MIRAFFEFIVCGLLIVGYMYEKEIIGFEVAVRKAICKKLKSKRKRKTVKYDILECENDNCVFLIPRK